jgi:hypothetical protein
LGLIVTEAVSARPSYERVRPKNVPRYIRRKLPFVVEVARGEVIPKWSNLPLTPRRRPLTVNMGKSWEPQGDWCEEHFGPSKIDRIVEFKGKTYVAVSNQPRNWANLHGRFYFLRPNDAFWFRLVWDIGKVV